MLENLETLTELGRLGTMTETSLRLRITQSAVSKRIAALEIATGVKLIEKEGRRVRLTEAGKDLLERTAPLLGELRTAIESSMKIPTERTYTIGVAETLFSSWGAGVLTSSVKTANIRAEYHVHRSPVVQDRVASGLYVLGICAGTTRSAGLRGLVVEELGHEEMVIIKARPKLRDIRSVVTVERSASTWLAIQAQFAKTDVRAELHVESFFAAAQMAKLGLLSALVPVGVARTLRIPKQRLQTLRPRVTRPVQLLIRKSRYHDEAIQKLLVALKKNTSRELKL